MLSPLEKAYALILLTIFGFIVLHAPLSVYFGSILPEASLLIKSWKELLMLLALPLAAIILTRRRLWPSVLSDRLLQIGGAYIILHLLTAAVLFVEPVTTFAGLAIDLRYIVFFYLVYILIKAAPQLKKRFLIAAAGGAAVVVGFAVLQIFLPPDILTAIGYGDTTIQPYLTVDKNPDFIRINSTMRGPNPLGAYTVIVMSLLAVFVVSGRLRYEKSLKFFSTLALALGSLAALWVSYSRSALGAAIVAVGLVGVMSLYRRISRRVWIGGAIILFGLVGAVVAGRDTAFVSHVILHENPADSNMVNSNDGHLESLENGFSRMLRQPFGAGIGSTGSASLLGDSPQIIENQYLFIAHEVGWLGFGLFIVLFGVILARLWNSRRDWLNLGVFTSGIGLAVIGLVLPVWTDDTVSIVWWGLAAVALGVGGKYDRQPAE